MIEDVKKIVLGWKREPKDDRDFFGLPDRVLELFKQEPLPERVDLRAYCSSIHNQGSLGSCTAQAITSALELIDNKSNNSYVDLSRLFLYFLEREKMGAKYIDEDSGAFIRDGIKIANKIGVCKESLWPYRINEFKKRPTEECIKDAYNHRQIKYYKIHSLIEFKKALASGIPVVFGIDIFESFYRTCGDGLVSVPVLNETYYGGHAVCVVGYDDSKEVLIVQNSWGDDWGHDGFCFLPYEFITKLFSMDGGYLWDDAWCIVSLNYDE